LPDNQGVDDALRCTELCTLDDGTTYVALPDGVDLPEQPPELAVTTVVLTDVLKDQIRAASPHVALIAERMVHKIRAAYTIDDEMYFARIGVGAATGMYTPAASELEQMQAFGEFVEGVRAWGRGERKNIGL
jgi:hypothetical protein